MAGQSQRATRCLLLSLTGVAAALAAIAIAAWLLASPAIVPGVSSLPFGLFVFAGVACLLAANALVKPIEQLCASRGAATAPTAPPVQHRPWHALDATACAATVEAPPDGLPAHVAAARLRDAGENVLTFRFTGSLWRALLKEVHEPQQMLLLLVAVLYALIGEIEEAGLALAVIALMMLAEVVTEYRAKRALASLQTAAPQYARVLRDGVAVTVHRATVVPGDTVLLQAGYEVPADVRLIACAQLQVDESRLTGESVPVVKQTSVLLQDGTPLAERSNMAYAGCVVSRGRGRGIVVATGVRSELGQVLASVRSAKGREKRTALAVLLKALARTLTYVAIAASVLGGLLGLIKSLPWQEILLIILSLAFATIPEELPILIAAVLAVGAQALGARNVFVKRLRAMEALANVDVVLTDKTGTLTLNRLHVASVLLARDTSAVDACSVNGATASSGLSSLLDAWRRSADDGSSTSISTNDPFDAAVLAAFAPAGEAGVAHAVADATQRRTCDAWDAVKLRMTVEEPFDPVRKLAVRAYGPVASDTAEYAVVYLKGAPESVLACCTHVMTSGDGGVDMLQLDADISATTSAPRQLFMAAIDAAASRGLRMVAYARGISPTVTACESLLDEMMSLRTMCMVGVLCYEDPLRPEVAAAVGTCAAAGVHVVMVTGDHPQAAAAIARQAGLLPAGPQSHPVVVHCTQAEAAHADDSPASAAVAPADIEVGIAVNPHATRAAAWADSDAARDALVFARATPAHKLQLVEAYQRRGHVVVVTGDGVNDAPALAAADVGIAVQDATDVAREACAMVVVDGDFSSLVMALREGRRLFDNLVDALAFYLGAKLGLIVLFIAGTIWDGFPLAPVQVIVLELYMDLGASLAFVAEPAAAGIMSRPPRKREAAFFDAIMIARIVAGGASMAACVLGGYGWGLRVSGGDLPTAQTMSFVCWLLGHVTLALNMRTATDPVLLVKSFTSNRMLLGWILSVIALALLVGFLPDLSRALALITLSPRDWGVAVGIVLASTSWIEAVKLVLWALRSAPGNHR